jgi:hypothetical protein
MIRCTSDAKPKANFTTDYSAREASVGSEAVAADTQAQSSADEMNVATFAITTAQAN